MHLLDFLVFVGNNYPYPILYSEPNLNILLQMLLARAEKDSAAIKVLLWIYAVVMVLLNQKHVSCRP